jgi:hypothetical protein
MRPPRDHHPTSTPSIVERSAGRVQVTVPAHPPQLAPGLARSLMKVLVASRRTSTERAFDEHAIDVDLGASFSEECQTDVVVS